MDPVETTAPAEAATEEQPQSSGWSIHERSAEQVAEFKATMAQAGDVERSADEQADSSVAETVAATIAATAEPDAVSPAVEETPAMSPDMSALLESNRQLTAMVTELVGAMASGRQADTAQKPELPPWQRPIDDSLQTAARAFLGEHAEDALVAEYTGVLRRQAAVEPYLEHADEAQARAAKQQHDQTRLQLRDLQREARLAALERQHRQQAEARQKAEASKVVTPEALQARVTQVFADPAQLGRALEQYPNLAKATELKAYDTADLAKGLDYSGDVWAQLDSRCSLLEAAYARVNFGDPPPAKPADEAAKSSGVRVADPRAFGLRNDEVGAPPELPTKYESLAEKNARLMAEYKASRPN